MLLIKSVNHLVWDMERLWGEIIRGLLKAAAKTGGHIDSVGIDGWGVDYALMDADGKRIGHSYCYRDARNVPAMEKVLSKISPDRLYEITGNHFLPFNTIYQLSAHKAEFPEEWERAARWLTLPEYFQYRMTGVVAEEYTEASTTQLLDVRTRTWSKELASTLGLNLGQIPAHRASRHGARKIAPGSQSRGGFGRHAGDCPGMSRYGFGGRRHSFSIRGFGVYQFGDVVAGGYARPQSGGSCGRREEIHQ